jgi:ABC-type multidrug transport system ATPase subunit
MDSLVEVQHLRKEFEDTIAVKDLSFTVQKGDIYGFLGQNGAGKSTSMRMMLTLIRPTSGSIKIFGMELEKHSKEILRQVGAIIEKPDVYKYLSAYDNLELFAKLSGIKPTKQQLMAELDKVGLADRAKSKAKTFSQGMKQRLGIAIALVHNPQLIILDEPTNGLDPQGIADMRHLIVSLSKEHGKTVVVSSHLLSEIEQIATRILIINKGEKIVEGTAAELFDPAHTIVELQTTNNEKAKVLVAQSDWMKSFKIVDGEKLIFEMHRNEIPEFNKYLVRENVDVVQLSPKHSLENYFLKLTE